jgi:uncharacterized protein
MTRHEGDGAARIVERLGLEPHPEGGWYRRTWASEVRAGGGGPDGDGRAAGSSILYLLDASGASRWHRIDASELWHHVAGAPLELSWWRDGEPTAHATLGPDLLDGESPQAVIDPGTWQSARTLGAWSLAACVVVPEFRFDGFELAPEGWSPPG